MLINVPGTHGKYYCNNISTEKYPKKYWSSKCIPDYSILDKLPNNISTEKYTKKYWSSKCIPDYIILDKLPEGFWHLIFLAFKFSFY